MTGDTVSKAATTFDFGIEAYTEKIPGHGEDAYVYSLHDNSSVVGVFDGCGGSGAKSYARVGNKTGAFLASRIAAVATLDWFQKGNAFLEDEQAAASLKLYLKRYLDTCSKVLGGASRIRGSLSKELPTTCAIMVMRRHGSACEALSLWAGDSRCYMLDAGGLHQLSSDDLDGYDAMQNLTADGALTNVISASQDFVIHTALTPVTGPCVLFTATDGCFGYLPTPMEFENLLLSTMAQAQNALEWDALMRDTFSSVAGDDTTLCGMSLGFGSFKRLQDAFVPRRRLLQTHYVHDLNKKTEDEKRALWDEYKQGYYRATTTAPKNG